jgi:hypothetical protein
MNADNDRERIERTMLEEVRRAEVCYHDARALSEAVAESISDRLFGHPDGDRARRDAARAEAAALERYRSAVTEFSDLVLHGRRPGSGGDDGAQLQKQLQDCG